MGTGSSHSIKEVQDHVENLKYKVKTFNGTVTSKHYHKLQTEIIQTNTIILKLKKSRKSSKASKQCDQMWHDVNECQRILRDKVEEKTGHNQISTEEKGEQVVITRRPKQDAAIVIDYLEEETKKIEEEIEKMIQTKDYRKQAFVEGKLKIFFTDVAIAKTETGSFLDVRKNQILQRLLRCYKHVRNDYDSDFDSDFDSEFESSSRNTDSTRTSVRSSIYEEISYFDRSSKPTQHSAYKKEKLQSQAQTNIVSKISYKTQVNFDDLLNIDQYDYEEIKKNGSRPSALSKKKVNLNLDELLQDNSYDNEEMDDFLNEVLEVTNKPFKKKNQNSLERPELDDHHQRQYENIERQSEIINSLNDELMKIKDQIEMFSGKYGNQQYVQIESDLKKCLEEMNSIDDLGDSALIAGKEEHIDYINKLTKYFEGIAKPAENQDEQYMTEEVVNRPEVEIRKTPKPPILKIPEHKTSGAGRRRSYCSDSDTHNEDFDLSGVILRSETKKHISNLHEGSETQRKIYPPIVKPMSAHEEFSKSDEENCVSNSITTFETQGDFKQKQKTQVKKIYPPIVKTTANRRTSSSSETNTNDDVIRKEKVMSDEEKSSDDFFWSNKHEFGDGDSNQEDNNEENVSDAINLELLKRMVSTEDSQVPYYKTLADEKEEEEKEEERDNNTTSTESATLMKKKKIQTHGAIIEGNYITNRNKTSYKKKLKRNKRKKPAASVDCTDKIEEILEDIEELKALNKNFKETQNYKIYAELQEKLMKTIRVMFDMNKANFDNKSLVLYEIVSQDIQTFVNEL